LAGDFLKENMTDNGWIKLNRSFIDWEWFDEPNMVWLFIKCLMMANWEDKKWHGISVPRGSFITSYANLSNKKAKVSVQMIRTALERLKSTGEITIKTTNQYTVISINNYNKYQDINTPNNKQITNEQQTNNKQITTTKEYKEIKNKYNTIESITAAEIKTISEQYRVSEKTEQGIFDTMSLWCKSKGKKYKDYYAALQNWTRRRIDENPNLVIKLRQDNLPDFSDIPFNPEKTKELRKKALEIIGNK
jgi:hypothetical protein